MHKCPQCERRFPHGAGAARGAALVEASAQSAQPVVAGVEHDVVGAGSADVGGQRSAPLGLERGVPLSHARA